MKRIKRYAPFIAILFVGLGTHGLLLLNDGIYWDDWLWVTALQEKNWLRIYTVGFSRGEPLDAYFQWFFSGFQNIEFVYKFVAFLSILLAAMLVYVICRQMGILTRAESLWIALISMVYPAFQTQILLSTTNYLFYYMLFLAGIFLTLKSTNSVSFWGHALRFGALILFFLSFSLGSLLVFYFGFLLIFVLYARRLQLLSLREMLTRFLPRHLDYILLPFLYWLIKETWFRPYGLYANYNILTFSLPVWIHNLVLFLNNGIYGQFKTALLELLNQPVLWLLVLLGAWLGWRYFKEKEPNSQSVRPYTLLAYGVLLMGLGIFPYIAVGLGPTLTGWSTRHSLLLALPVALVIVAIARLFFHDPRRGFSLPGWILLVTLLLAFGLATVSTYIDWQARWVHDRSLMVNLPRVDGSGDYSVYWVDNQYPLGGDPYVQFYEYSSMFKQIWGDETRLGYPGIHPDMPAYIKSVAGIGYNLDEFDPAGCQATLTIYRGTLSYSEFGLVARYFYYKFLRPQRMPGLLDRVTQVEVQPYSLLAADCMKR